MREIRAWAARGGAGTGAAGVDRIRTTRPLRNGSIWMSLARSSMALQQIVDARTTAPARQVAQVLDGRRRRARRPDRALDEASSSSPRRSVSAVAMSSNEATSISTGGRARSRGAHGGDIGRIGDASLWRHRTTDREHGGLAQEAPENPVSAVGDQLRQRQRGRE